MNNPANYGSCTYPPDEIVNETMTLKQFAEKVGDGLVKIAKQPTCGCHVSMGFTSTPGREGMIWCYLEVDYSGLCQIKVKEMKEGKDCRALDSHESLIKKQARKEINEYKEGLK